MKAYQLLILAVAAGFILAGCKTDPLPTPEAAAGSSKAGPLYTPSAQAGVTLENPSAGMETVQQIADNRYWRSRHDPFGLTYSESMFDQQQRLESVLDDLGGFGTYFEVPEESEDTGPRMEPVPAWRLAGVVISEGAVLALLDKSPGVEVIRPGSRIEGTDWVCVSIDADSATFRRDGNVLPKEIVVPLGAPLLPGGGSGGTGGGTGGAGGPAGVPGGRSGGLGVPGGRSGGR